MTGTFTSVTLFYAALRDAILTQAGWTVERTLGTYDAIYTSGSGRMLRLRKETVSGSIAAVSLMFGTDGDVLSVSTDDPEMCFPFDTSGSDAFSATIQWWADLSILQMMLTPASGSSMRCYRAEFNFEAGTHYVRHEDPSNSQYAPSFKVSGGPYLQSGA